MVGQSVIFNTGGIVVFKVSAVGKRLFFGGRPFSSFDVSFCWYLLE